MYNNISLFFSSDCNMSCVYCDINKNKPCMASNNKIIREKMASGEYAQNVINRLGHLKNEMTDISLWGMEPTINATLFESMLYPLLDHFTNVTQIAFSTNMWLGYKPILSIFNSIDHYCKEHNRQINLSLQVSIDGDKWINDTSRREGTTENSIKTIRDVIINTPKDNKALLSIQSKCTLDVTYMRKMNEDKSLLVDFFAFFDKLQTEMEELNDNPKVSIYLSGFPTLVNPGYHTADDGRTLAEFIHNLRDIDVSAYAHYHHPLIVQPMNGLTSGIDSLSRDDMRHWGCCSSGYYTANIDCNGNLFNCHALFSRSFIDNGSVVTDGQTTCNATDKVHDAARLQYVNALWHDYPESRENFVNIMIYALASAGQIDGIYLTSPKWRKALYYAMGGLFCQSGHSALTGSVWAIATSQIKYLGNGALQEIIGYMHDCGMLED